MATTTYLPPAPNPALYTNEKHEIYMAPSPELDVGPHDCVVHVKCNGICGSDVHFWHTGRIGSLVVRSPHCLGHEAAGQVVHVGSAVTTLEVGDRVAIEPGIPCARPTCSPCSTGTYNLCPDVRFSGVPPHAGSIRRFHVHPAAYLHRLPDRLNWAEGALLEPLSVVLRGFERCPVGLGEAGVVCGAGPIGLIALAVAKASGARPLVITDVDEGRLAFAERFVPGAKGVRVQEGLDAEAMAGVVRGAVEKQGGLLPRVVYECTGVQGSVVTASFIARRGGEVMVIGVGRQIMDGLPFMYMSMAEVDLKFINRYHHSWPVAMRLLAHGVLDLKPLITHRFPLDEAVRALETAADRGSGAIKVHIEDGDSGEAGGGGRGSKL